MTSAAPPLPPHAQRKTSGLAICSLICGLGSLLLGFLTGIPAIVTGHIAMSKIGRNPATLSGSGMALTGLILGYLMSLLSILVLLATPAIFKSLKRAELTNAVNDARQVKLALDAFAAEFDGQFPNEDTAEEVAEGGTSTTYSNDYFRQLFLSGATNSELIFWVKHSPVAGRTVPDNEVGGGFRKPDPAEILKPGDVHWAYVSDQSQVDQGSRPLLLDCYKPGSSEFDQQLWDHKVVVAHIDGSVKAMRMRVSDGKVLDKDNRDILSQQSDAWGGENPQHLLKQPQPSR